MTRSSALEGRVVAALTSVAIGRLAMYDHQ